jgi:hypothetical protein
MAPRVKTTALTRACGDLYYEITRASFPLSMGELGRIFLNMQHIRDGPQ